MGRNTKWHWRFMSIAMQVASWSKDPSTKVGVVLVKDRRIISTGYNGFPPGIADDERLKDRPAKYAHVVHAEMNALLQPGAQPQGCTLYLWSHLYGPPCSNCMKHIIAAGVEHVVWEEGPASSRWADDLALGLRMAQEARLKMTALEGHNGR